MVLFAGTAEDDPEYVEAQAEADRSVDPVIEKILAGPTVDELRHAEYIKPGGADSLYMKWQAGDDDAAKADWLAERERVRLLYPDPAE